MKFLHYKDKDAIPQTAKYLRSDEKISIDEDFSERIKDKPKMLMPELKAQRAKGKLTNLVYDRLIVKDRLKPEELKDEGPETKRVLRPSSPTILS